MQVCQLRVREEIVKLKLMKPETTAILVQYPELSLNHEYMCLVDLRGGY